MVPPLKTLRKKTLKKKDGEDAAEDPEDKIDPYLLKMDKLHPFDIDDYESVEYVSSEEEAVPSEGQQNDN